jgi:hypothetical protein
MAVGEEQNRQIAMHAGKIGQRQIGLSPIDLEPAAGIGAAIKKLETHGFPSDTASVREERFALLRGYKE